ncbi:MAG TPA: 16S rRNA (uracil(1498)-N(3))-methyltransferase [Pyrinomonadaceae bacterium]|nr:16S rRNA (uracil(1498)-N(3))-methyltransferase [Pyrinomonadaceae bacterium]
MELKRFYCAPDAISDNFGLLAESETHHLRDVIRLKSGDKIRVFDGVGNEFDCRIRKIGRNSTEFEITGRVAPAAAESPLDLTIAAVILKGDKFDYTIQKAVELGVKRLVPLRSEFCAAPTDTSGKRLERWRKIALEATKQCGRACLMQVSEPRLFQDAAAELAAGNSKCIQFSERMGRKFSLSGKIEKITAFIGPEGGWSDRELELAKKLNIEQVTFGGRIMKADTAAVAIVSILQHLFGDLN